MLKDSIFLGTTYPIVAAAQDAAGAAVAITGSWEVACRVVAGSATGETVADLEFTIADGQASSLIDTGEAPWAAGKYYYDVRLTDPDGREDWSETVQLTIKPRITPQAT